jgi:PAS domain-containing protein
LPIEKSRMKKIFDTWWPQLDAELRVIQVKRLVSVERVADGIKCLIQSSNLPMLFLDRELILQSCNDEFASLIGVRPGEILNKHWSFSLELFARRVPPLFRAEFLKTQSEMIESPSTMEGLVAPNLGGHRDAVVYIDNRDIAKGDRYPHLYRVWIHADKVEGYGEVIGIFAVYRLEKLLDDTKTEDLRSITIGID